MQSASVLANHATTKSYRGQIFADLDTGMYPSARGGGPAVMPSAVHDYQAIKTHNAVINLTESRAGAIELRSMSRYIMIELTQGCNLRCPCAGLEKSLTVSESSTERSARHCLRYCFPLPGLLAPDINNVIQLVAAYQARCRVVTNLSVGSRPGNGS